MAAPAETRTVSVTIHRDWHAVYAFARMPENLPLWASGVSRSIRREGDHWVADAPEGPVTIRFSARNDFGVLDHFVSLPSGVEVYMPARVVANGDGAEVSFTLFRRPGMSDDAFAADAQWIARDLAALRAHLES